MTTLKTIEMARKHLPHNGSGYAGIVSGMIRSGYSAKIKAARAAIVEPAKGRGAGMSAIAIKATKPITHVGFGCPVNPEVARFVVVIPRGTLHRDKIRIREYVGGEYWEDRIVLSRAVWDIISSTLQSSMNDRLAAAKPRLKASRWRVGDNPVERQLGLELLCLAYATELQLPGEIRTATLNWLALTPEERRWLAMKGLAEGSYKGWRQAIGIALTERVKA